MEPIIKSLLDTDFYKLTMHAAIFKHFRHISANYKYTNRTPQKKMNNEGLKWLRQQIDSLAELRFSKSEIEYLSQCMPFPAAYLNALAEFRLNPKEQINLKETTDGDLELTIGGSWFETTLYEIPLLSLVSEAYFRFVDTDWVYDGQIELIKSKCSALMENDCAFSEFGTRRRRSFKTQDLVMQGIMEYYDEHPEKKGLFLGTSNVLLAKKYGVKPIGTVAHEWFMGIAAITGDYNEANKLAMNYWLATFGVDHAGLALTDTFGTDAYLKHFVPPYSDFYTGVRQDSGDPIKYCEKIAHHYLEVLKLERFSKVICFSDSLNVDRCIEYKKKADEEGLKASFGIGTFLTNDFTRASNKQEKSKPLNIVIKLQQCNGNHAVKISDDLGKNMGDRDTVAWVKSQLGYTDSSWKGGDESKRW